jgi:competence protein ComEC
MLGGVALARVPSRLATLVTIVLLVGYAHVVGSEPSVSRATLMAAVYLSARMLDHRSRPMNALAVAVAAIVCVAPLTIYDPGFLLTVGATGAILAGVPGIVARLPASWWARAPGGLFAASLSAEAALMPVAASVFSRVTFAGLLLNFAAIPLMTVAQIAGLAVLGAAALDMRAAVVPGYVAHLATAGLVESARLVELAPWVARRVPAPPGAVVVLYYAGWLFATAIQPPRRLNLAAPAVTRWWRTAAVAAIVTSTTWILAAPVPTVPWGARRQTLRVTFLDVAHGDAVLVRFPDGRVMLVDAGGTVTGRGFDVGSRVVVPAAWALDVRRLDWFVLTHADPDHIGGAFAVIRDLGCREVWEGVPVPSSVPLGELKRQARAVGAAWRTVRPGDVLESGGAVVRVLHPPAADWERQRVRNDDSIVMEVSFGDVAFLLTGDIGQEAEREVAPLLDRAPLRVIKVPHHGSRTSSSAGFVSAARPAAAVFSTGRGAALVQIAPDMLKRYSDIGAVVFRTDRDGAVNCETDGQSLHVTTFNGRSERFTAAVRPPPP